jgi:Pyocin activator protein PrtN
VQRYGINAGSKIEVKNKAPEKPTYAGLLLEFGAGTVELERVCTKYLGLKFSEAKRRAALSDLPVPAFRCGSQKAPWLVSLADLAGHLDARLAMARADWRKMHSGTARPGVDHV